VLYALGFQHGFSPATRSEIARQSVLCSSYEEAREQLERGGLKVGVSTITRVAVATGKEALELRNRAIEAALKGPQVEHSVLEGKRVRISLDGGRARVRRTLRGRGIRPGQNGRRPFTLDWREPRLLTVDLLDENGEVDRSVKPIYETSLANADGTFDLLVGTLRLLGVHHAKQVIFVADGADWIWNRIIGKLVDEVGINPERLFVALDYYHATQSISDALKECKNLNDNAREELRKELNGLLLEPGGAAQVLKRLRPLARGRRARPINRCIRYLQKKLALMDYAFLRSKRLSIGSGMVESAIRRVINLRFKSASMCWTAEHLEPLVYLRAILKAGHWDEYFKSFLLGRHWVNSETTLSPTTQSDNADIMRHNIAL